MVSNQNKKSKKEITKDEMEEVCEKCKENAKWARHYDNMLWLVTSIFLIAIAYLITSSIQDIKTSLLGMLITFCLLYFATGFRQWKQKNMPENTNGKIDNKPELPQWEIYVFLLYAIGAYWIIDIVEYMNSSAIRLSLFLSFWLLVVVFLYDRGKFKNH